MQAAVRGGQLFPGGALAAAWREQLVFRGVLAAAWREHLVK